jgi:thiol-disulfide isomerase/thioredoxin
MSDKTETFSAMAERLRPERENQPEECSHCDAATPHLTNYSRPYGGNVGGHWLCRFCEVTRSASRLGAGLLPDNTVRDIAGMLNVLAALVGDDR